MRNSVGLRFVGFIATQIIKVRLWVIIINVSSVRSNGLMLNRVLASLTTNGLEEHSTGSAEVEGSSGRIDIATFAQVRQVLDLVAVKVSGEV